MYTKQFEPMVVDINSDESSADALLDHTMFRKYIKRIWDQDDWLIQNSVNIFRICLEMLSAKHWIHPDKSFWNST